MIKIVDLNFVLEVYKLNHKHNIFTSRRNWIKYVGCNPLWRSTLVVLCHLALIVFLANCFVSKWLMTFINARNNDQSIKFHQIYQRYFRLGAIDFCLQLSLTDLSKKHYLHVTWLYPISKRNEWICEDIKSFEWHGLSHDRVIGITMLVVCLTIVQLCRLETKMPP